ncbi:MAG: hypothetical protein JO246_13965 [Frankiaceae bacterium]|nr:hypothetical protein [Frankiaceae bacterium]MBV9871502.1 hypothetical protein [Frankiaceae bacterium]
MTTQLLDLAADDQLAEAVGDAALAALLRSKPADDEIPSAVWWLIAETLRTSVTIRREVTSASPPDLDTLATLLTEASLLTEAALAELAETTSARPMLVSMPPSRADHSRVAPTRPTFGLQLSILFLARMLVGNRTTTPQRLANTLAAHLRALAVLEVDLHSR